MNRKRKRPRSAGRSPEDPAAWRALTSGARLVLRPPLLDDEPSSKARAAGRLECEVRERRYVTVPDEKGNLLAEYLFFDLLAGESLYVLVVLVAQSRLEVRLCATQEAAAGSRAQLRAQGLEWLFEGSALEYTRYPVVPVVEAGRQRAVPFESVWPVPLAGEYAAPDSERAVPLLIVEYAALEPCEEPILILLEDSTSGGVTLLTGGPIDPTQIQLL